MLNNDIVPELLEKIKQDFFSNAEKSSELEKLLLLLKDGKATYKDSYRFATKIGEILSAVLQENINNNVLPEGKMYFNIADRILNEMFETNHKMVSSYAKNIQEELNKQAGLGLKSVIAPINQNRIDSLVNRLSHESSFDEVSWILGAPVVNFSQNVVDNHIKANAEFHYKSGLKAKVVRTTNGKCCEWCDKLAGVYFYPKVDKNVFRRHDRCDCVVEYYPGDGKKQNVWGKQWSNDKGNGKIKPIKDIPNVGAVTELKKKALKQGIEYRKIKKTSLKSEEAIIQSVGGGDMTKGSCSSVAMAYIGNKAGYDVRDFRDGDSRKYFATRDTVEEIAKLPNVKSYIVNDTNDFKGVKQLLSNVQEGKEYYLATGGHAAIIRKNENSFEYLELQHPDVERNKFYKLDRFTLKSRFGCQASHSIYRQKYEVSNILIETESLQNSPEFLDLLGFINTQSDKQVKGSKGNVK